VNVPADGRGSLHEPSRLFVLVGFSDEGRLALVVRFGVVVFVLVIIIVVVGGLAAASCCP
jgi:hypothetical protein